MSLRRLTPALAALAVLALVLGIALALRAGGGGDARPGVAGSSAGDPVPLTLVDRPLPGPGAEVEPRWRLTGDLPQGTPDAVTLQSLDGADRAAAARLAAALGLPGHGSAVGSATVWTSGAASLRVAADGRWAYGGFGCRPVVAAGDDTTGTFGSVRCLQPPVLRPEVIGGSPADTDVALRVLDAAGIEGHRVLRPVRGSSTATVLVEPVVAGRRAGGMATVLQVTGERLTEGSGWLPTVQEGAAYPVVDARTAWEQLRHTLLPQTLIACSVPEGPGTDPLLCGGPVEVTDARLGRTVAHLEDGRTVLVPAWLFAVAGRDQAYPVVALPPRLLPDSSATGGSGGGITGGPVPSAPASSAPSGPVTGTVAPTPGRGPGKAPVSPEPANPGSRFSAVRATGPSALSVSFTGGVDTCYDYRVVVADGSDRVRLSLKQAVTSDRACVDLAQVYRRTVALPSPLAGRPVVDAESGAVLLAGSGG